MNTSLTTLTRLSLVMASLLLLPAFHRGNSTTLAPDLAGTYILVSVNGNAVPAAVSHQGASVEVRSGIFTLRADGTCRSETVFVPPSGTEVTRQVEATYTRQGSGLSMRWKGAGETTGNIAGDTFTMNNEGIRFEYRKQAGAAAL